MDSGPRRMNNHCYILVTDAILCSEIGFHPPMLSTEATRYIYTSYTGGIKRITGTV